jgi:hypothetical protein
MKTVHVQLAYEGRNISVLKILAVICELRTCNLGSQAHERTFEKSLEGDMTKLSAEFDQDIKCCML